MARQLDKQKPYGTVWGATGENPAVYEQDNILFDGNGNEILSEAERAKAAAAAAAKTPK